MSNNVHQGYIPGDVVRDRRTAIDYVIQSVTIVAGGGALLYMLVGVIDDRLRTEVLPSALSFGGQFMSIIENGKRLPPATILTGLREKFEKALNQDRTLYQELDKPENAKFRDLLYLSGEGSESTFDKGLVDLARGLVYAVEGRPSREAIRQIITTTAQGTNLSQEMQEQLIEDAYKAVTSAAVAANRQYLAPREAQQGLGRFLVSGEMQVAKNVGLLSRELPDYGVLRNWEKETLLSVFERQDIENYRTAGHEFWGQLDSKSTQYERISMAVSEVLRSLTGQEELSSTMQALIARETPKAMSMLRKGRVHPLTHLVMMGTNMREAQAGLMFKPTEALSWFSRHMQKESRVRIQRTGTGFFGYLRGVRPRIAGGVRGTDLSRLRPLTDWGALISGDNLKRSIVRPHTGRMLSLDRDTVFNDLLRNARFKMQADGQELSLKMDGVSKQLYAALGFSQGEAALEHTQSLLINPQDLRKIVTAKEAGQAMDLSNVIRNNEYFQSLLAPEARAQLRAAHYPMNVAGHMHGNGPRMLDVYLPNMEDIAYHKRSAMRLSHVMASEERSPTDRILRYLNLHLPLADPTRERVFQMDIQDTAGRTVRSLAHTDLETLYKQLERERQTGQQVALHHTSVVRGKLDFSRGPIELEHSLSELKTLFDRKKMQEAKVDLGNPKSVLNALRERVAPPGTPDAKFSRIWIQPVKQSNERSLEGIVAQQRIAISVLKKAKGDKELKVLGTNITESSVAHQLTLTEAFFRRPEDRLVVDIETLQERTDNPDLWFMRSMAWGRTADLKSITRKRDTTRPLTRAKAILQLVEEIKNSKVVASHGSLDPNQLVFEARRLSSDPSVLAKGLSNKLLEAAAVLEEARRSKWLDLTLVHSLRTGESLRSVNQSYLTLKFLRDQEGRPVYERHDEHMDVFHALQLADQGQEDIMQQLAAVRKAGLHEGDDVQKMGVKLLGVEPLSNKYSRVFAIEGLHEGVGAQGQPVVFAHFREFSPVMEGGRVQFKPNDLRWTEEHESVNALEAAIADGTAVVDSRNWGKMKPLYEASQKNLSARELRQAINPLARRPYDPIQSYSRSVMRDLGPMSEVSYAARFKAREMFPQLEAEMSRQQIAKGETLENVMESSIQRLLDGMGSDWSETLKPYVAHELRTMRTSQSYKQRLTDSKVSDIAALMELPYGRLKYEAIRAQQTEGKGALVPTLMDMILRSDMSEKGATETFDAGLQLSVSLGRTSVGLKYGDGSTRYIEKQSRKLDSLAAEFLLEMTRDDKRKGTPHAAVLEAMGYNPEQVESIKQAVEQMRANHGVDDLSIREWKQMIERLTYIHEGDDTAPGLLRTVMKDLRYSEHGVQGALIEAVNKRQLQLLSSTADEESELKAARADKVLKTLGELKNMDMSAADMHRVAFTMHQGEDLEFMRQKYDVESTKYVLDLTQQDAERIKEQAEAMHHALAVSGDRDIFDLSDAIDSSIHSAWNEGHKGMQANQHAVGLMRGQMEAAAVHRQAMADMGLTVTGDAMKDTTAQTLAEGMNAAQAAGANAAAGSKRTVQDATHEAVLVAGRGIKSFENLRTPLYLIGGALALLAAKEPYDDAFSQGKTSKGLGFIAPHAAKYAEIPGTNLTHTVWNGDPQPFRLDITFSGFVDSKHGQEQLVRHVFNTVDSHMEIRSNTTQVEDERAQNHRRQSRELLRSVL